MPINLKKYPLTTVLIAVIWVVCLIPIPETPLSSISMIDKWTHLVMYGGTFGVMWWEWGRRRQGSIRLMLREMFSAHCLLWGWLLPVVMSGLIELAQAYCTGGNRSGDWLDFAANTLGVCIALMIGVMIVWVKRLLKRL